MEMQFNSMFLSCPKHTNYCYKGIHNALPSQAVLQSLYSFSYSGKMGESWIATERSILSWMSYRSILSIGSAGSILSIGSVGSILSIGSAGSILSVGSAGCILSVLSAGSMLSVLSAISMLRILQFSTGWVRH
jgi:hypothetical protein